MQTADQQRLLAVEPSRGWTYQLFDSDTWCCAQRKIAGASRLTPDGMRLYNYDVVEQQDIFQIEAARRGTLAVAYYYT